MAAAIDYAAARTILQKRIADASNATEVDQAIDQAQREFAKRHFWPELRVRAFFQTYAAYQTGTVATDGTTQVVLTGGVWPATVESLKWRFALSNSAPWYTAGTRDSDTVLQLAEAYIGSDETASKFIIYKSHYSMPSTVDRIEQIWIHRDSEAVELKDATTDEEVSDFRHYPDGPGTPTHFLPIEEDASGNAQILLGPATPDTAWRVEYTARRKTVDGTFEFPDRWPAVLAKASSILYENRFYERHLRALQVYETLVATAIAEDRDVEQPSGRLGDDRVNYGPEANRPLAGSWTIEDPT